MTHDKHVTINDKESDFLSPVFHRSYLWGVLEWPPTARFMEAVQGFIAHFVVFNGFFLQS